MIAFCSSYSNIIMQITVKLGAKTVERFFSLADNNFVEDVNDDIQCFVAKNDVDRVLVFPPVSNYRRFLIHQCVEQIAVPKLSTFSIGVGDERRTVVCFLDKVLSDVACAQPAMGLSQADRESAITRTDAGECKADRRARSQPQEKIRSGSARPRRPDRAVYVPRALRASDTGAGDTAAGDPADDPPTADTRKRQTSVTPTVKPPKSPRDKSLPGTPRKSIDKAFCNVYTPPHLRSQRSHTEPSICDQTEYVPSVPNSDSAIEFSDNNCNEIGNNFYIGDYFANGQLGLYNPNYYYSDIEKYSDLNGSSGDPNESNELNMAVPDANTNIIDNGYGLHYNKDEDVEANELRRASREINRSSKRIIKQSFDSDVLVISDPVEDNKAVNDETQKETNVTDEETSPVKPKQKLEPRLSLKREENDWDAVFDDSGECLDPSLLEELTATVGKVHISKAKNNYDQYQTRGQALFSGPVDESFAHVVEVYDFPSEFKTNDLLSVFSEYKDTGFEIKWVDDTHALIVFSSAKIAAEVLSAQKPLVRCRPLHAATAESRGKAKKCAEFLQPYSLEVLSAQKPLVRCRPRHAATAESRGKAKKCAEFLQPYRQRPETCTALARRLVSGALGVKLSTARQERAEERRLITIAREKKRQAALHKEAAWDGSLGQPLGDT